LIKAIWAEGDGESSLKAVVATSTFKVNNLKEAIDLYLEKLKATGEFSAVTQRKYGWLGRELGHIPIKSIAESFREWLKVYANTPSRTGKPRTPATMNFVVNVVKAVCNHLVELEILPKNPITKSKFPLAKTKPRFVTLTPEEVDRLLEVIQKERPDILPIVRFMLAIPCRAFSELVNAKVDQLQDNNTVIFIPTSKNGDSIFKPVPLAMADYFNSIPNGCPWLFYQKVDGEYHPLTNLRHAFEVCRKKAAVGFPNLSTFRIHDLRHLAVSGLVLHGLPVQLLMKICGWKKDQSHIYCNISQKSGAEYFLSMEKEALKLASQGTTDGTTK